MDTNDTEHEPIPFRPATHPPDPFGYPPAYHGATSALTMTGPLHELFAAKAKARRAFKAIVKNRHVKVQTDRGPYEFDYATLDSVRASVDDALSDNGLDLFHVWCDGPEGQQELHAILSHASGAMIKSVLTFSKTQEFQSRGETIRRPMKHQEVGSLLTYWERYSTVALLGVASEAEDDGNAADGNSVLESRDRYPSRAPTPKAKEPPKEDPKPKAVKSAGAPANEVAAPDRQRELLKEEIRKLMAEMKMPSTELAVMCREQFGKDPKDCTDAEVADLIERLREIRASEGAAE